jgi:hypothetical protein
MSIGMLLWTMLAWSQPGAVTLNGVDVSDLRDERLRGVDVFIDEKGRVHLASDRYRVLSSSRIAEVGAFDLAPEPAPVRPPPPTGDVPPGSYWLVSVDNGTTGHEILVRVNGATVRTIRSGDPQVIEDISRHLRRGKNEITFDMRSDRPSGRTLFVYIGRGRNEQGTLVLGTPEIQHALGPTRQGALVRTFELSVD